MLDLLIKNGQCFIEEKVSKKDIAVKNGKILKIDDAISEKSKETIDVNKNSDL